MAYLPLRNYKYDSGPHRIQSGPDHEGYIVVSSGVRSIGADNGIIVDGTPLSGVAGSGQRWGYDANWRYVPLVPPSAGELLNPTAYQASGALDTYSYARVSTPVSIAGAKVVSSVESDVTFENRTSKKFVYYGGGCPDNQDYSPFNTPDSNTAAEGRTGGGVTHQLYESPLLTNVLGSQGTSDRSQWQYNQPVYCSVYTEAVRPETPGLMSSVVRSTYRGGSTSYMANYATLLLGDPGGFEELEYDDFTEEGGEEEEIVIGPTPTLWLAYTTEVSDLSYVYQDTSIELDAYCNSYHCLVWGSGGQYFVQVVKRQPDGNIIWQKNYGAGVINVVNPVVTEFDNANQILYVYADGNGLHYFLSISENGSVRYSRVIYDPSFTHGLYTVWSLNVNPVTQYVTIAGSLRTPGYYSNNGVLITYDLDGNLINEFTKISTVTNLNGGSDRDNNIMGVCYDTDGSMYIGMRYYNRDEFWNSSSGRNALLLGKIEANGTSSLLQRIGNFLRQDQTGYNSLTISYNQTLYLTANSNLYALLDNELLSINRSTLTYNQLYTWSPSGLKYTAKTRSDGLTYIFSRGVFTEGRMQALDEANEIYRTDIGPGNSFEMKEGEISDQFDFAVGSFGRQTSGSRGRFYCVGFDPFGSGTNTVSSGGVSYSIGYIGSPTVPRTLPTGKYYMSTGTSFYMAGQGYVHPDGFTFSVNQTAFSCPVVDTVSPIWRLIASSGLYDP